MYGIPYTVSPMQIREQILTRIGTFLAKQGLGRSLFGELAVGDRRFVRELEKGVPVTLGRIELAEAFMARVEADPKVLEGLRQSNQESPAVGVPFAAGEFDQASRDGEFAHGEMGNTDLPDRHLERVQR
jgi:hypothetical protein